MDARIVSRRIPGSLTWTHVAVTSALGAAAGILLVVGSYGWSPNSEQAWILGGLITTAVMWLLLCRRVMLRPRTMFEPRAIYPAVYAAMFTVGTWNITERGGQVDPSILGFFGLGLAFYYFGGGLFEVALLRRRRLAVVVKRDQLSLGDKPALRRCSMTVVIFGLGCLALSWISIGGMPIFDESLRLGLNSYFAALSQSSWLGILVAGSTFHAMRRSDRIRFVMLALVVVGMLGVGGYRAPIVLGGLTAVIAVCLGTRRVQMRFVVLTGIVLVIAITVIPLVRDSYKYGYHSVRATYVRQGIPEGMVLLGPIYAVAREGPLIFSSLRDAMRGTCLGGSLLVSDWLSMLPGKQDNSRVIVRNLIQNPTDTSKTPSVIGTLYVDFGVPGICVGMLLLSLYFHVLYERWRSSGSLSSLLIYSLTLAYGLISIHTGGYCEPVYVVSCLFIVLLPRVASLMDGVAWRSIGNSAGAS